MSTQIKNCFDYRWTKSDFGQDDEKYEKNIKQGNMNVLGLSEKDLNIFNNKIILDIGVGSGSSARMWASRAKEFHAIDVSKGIYRVKNALKTSISNPVLLQADLHHLPYNDDTFDMIISIGVLHHTPSTKIALKNIIKKLKPNGLCLFYIYKKKSPIRELSDDFMRSKISNLSSEQVWNEMKQITNFAKSLHEQNIVIKIPNDIDLFEIKKGEYNLQRFIYHYFFKCFWNTAWGFTDSNWENYDWYYPKYNWRQTEQEIREWCKEFSLSVKYIKEQESGYSCMVEKQNKS